VSGATQYEFGVSIKPYGTENVVWGGVTASASAPVPAGYLLAGQEYRWNVRAGNSAGWSAWSVQRLYFQTDSGTGGETETIMLPGNVPLDMVWIPAGTFMMGRYPGEQDSYDDEDPQHEVTLTHGFWMGKYELTKAQWTAVMGTEPWSGRDYVLDHPDSPAVCVNWNDAQAFIAALNDYTGKTFRLPSEAEWEYACRAGTTTRFYWGDDPSYTVGDDYCWWEHNVRDVNEKYAHVVGQKLPNAWGLYDMSGNVLEWCEDDSHENYIGAPADGSAWVDSPRGSYRVLRGGSWSSVDLDLRSCRSAARTGVYLAPFACRYGFRVVCVSSR
jgi:formylglycine-generating enzyme required for sulfatase activity